MHNLFSGGVTNKELAGIIAVENKKNPDFLDLLNHAISTYDWPENTKCPLIHASVVGLTKEGYVRSDAHVRLSGAQTLHFAQVRSHPQPQSHSQSLSQSQWLRLRLCLWLQLHCLRISLHR